MSRRYVKLDLTEIKEHLRLVGNYTVDEQAIRETIKNTLTLIGGYYVPLHTLTTQHTRYAVVNPGLYIPLGKFTDMNPWHSECRETWKISVSGTPGSQIYSGLESNLYQLHFTMIVIYEV
jgi:hypothetical protein